MPRIPTIPRRVLLFAAEVILTRIERAQAERQRKRDARRAPPPADQAPDSGKSDDG